jgi:hypothetical protein
VVTGPKEITFVFIDDLTDPDQAEANARYDELYDRGLCNLARPVANVGLTDLTAGGMTR